MLLEKNYLIQILLLIMLLVNIGKKIELCRIINRTLDFDQITAESGCGYCWESNKILYGE